MITSLRLVNFKSFADETLRVGPFTVIVGANASGKSNIRDSFRFLHGIGRGYTLAEILGGKYGEGGQREWAGIRGAPNEISRFLRASGTKRTDFYVRTELVSGAQRFYYSIKVRFNPNRPDRFRVLQEELKVGSQIIYTTDTGYKGSNLAVLMGRDREQRVMLSRIQPALTQPRKPGFLTSDYHQRVRLLVRSTLEGMRFMELVPERMREPAFPGATVLSDSGENLPTVLEAICSDPARRGVLISWVQELTPMDVTALEFPRDHSGRVHLQIIERNGRKVSAYSASDGTLRFLGMLAALLSPKPAGLYFFEEIDNGIHPNRLWLLVELIERQTAKNGIQVITTTHSPEMLNYMNDTTFENTSITYRDEKSADAIIRPIAELPNARELRKSQGLGRLHTSGWMETALAFTESGYDEGSEDGE